MSSEAIVGTVVGVTVGVVASHIGHQFYRTLVETIHQAEIEETKKNSFQEGWAAASASAKNIRTRYEEMFSTQNGGKGTTMKAPEKA